MVELRVRDWRAIYRHAAMVHRQAAEVHDRAAALHRRAGNRAVAFEEQERARRQRRLAMLDEQRVERFPIL